MRLNGSYGQKGAFAAESQVIVRNPWQSARRGQRCRKMAHSAWRCGFRPLGHPEEDAASHARGRWFETSRAHSRWPPGLVSHPLALRAHSKPAAPIRKTPANRMVPDGTGSERPSTIASTRPSTRIYSHSACPRRRTPDASGAVNPLDRWPGVGDEIVRCALLFHGGGGPPARPRLPGPAADRGGRTGGPPGDRVPIGSPFVPALPPFPRWTL